MKEYDFIKFISEKRRRSPEQLNNAFEADAEIIMLDGSPWAFTVDEFSQTEDFFVHDEPEVIGWNLAIATMSDLFACGVKPEFFLQTISRASTEGEEFYKKLMSGVFAALDACGCFLLGGDIGSAAEWRYNGTAFGKVAGRAVTRVLDKEEEFDIWISGECGDANAAVLARDSVPRFELRMKQAEIVAKAAGACTDTSGGFCDALWNLKEVNPGFDFTVDLNAIPYPAELVELFEQYELPLESALIGGAGEYELLVLVPKDRVVCFEADPVFSRIGYGCPVKGQGSIKFSKKDAAAGGMFQPPPCFRSCSEKDYIKTALNYYKENFCL